MNEITKQPLLSPKNVVIIVLGIVVGYLLFSTLVDSRFSEIEDTVKEQIAEQEAVLTAIAVTTARNGADAVTESIVNDCGITDRSNFDSLLGRLNDGLSRTQLIELERLFGRCGSFYSERKSVMVARLAREIEVYEKLVAQLEAVTLNDLQEEYSVDQWSRLAEEEQKQSDLFSELVVKQESIITTLLTGSSATSPEIIAILQEVREVQESLVLANTQASTIRSELVPL